MEKKSLWKSILWASVIVPIVMSTATNTEVPATALAQVTEGSTSYSWSAWGTWSRCSRSCGGGVSMQERQCLPRRSTVPEGTLAPPIVTVRVTRQTHSADCLGVARRFRQCNNEPCPGNSRGLRAEQCAAYDRRPFRGHFYTWVPYIDGDSPCTLNCRPLGQHFYASLALVADGTPCTKPGYHAICVQGECKTIFTCLHKVQHANRLCAVHINQGITMTASSHSVNSNMQIGAIRCNLGRPRNYPSPN